jgi:hypothetical protein
MAENAESDTVDRGRDLHKEFGLTLHDLGLKMGFAVDIAFQSAFQFMKSSNPRLLSLKRFAKTLGDSDSEADRLLMKGSKCQKRSDGYSISEWRLFSW